MTGPGNSQTPGSWPLQGLRILVTRSADQAPALSDALAARGAEPVVIPTIRIVAPASYAQLDRAIAGLAKTDYLVLTSVVPENYRAEGVVALLKERVSGKRVLYPKAALARELIPAELAKAGAEVVAPTAYASAAPEDAPHRLGRALAEGLDLLTFTASSTVDNFVNLLGAEDLVLARQVPVASIGPLTTATAKNHGFNVVVEPVSSTLDDMVEAIARHFAQQ
jgi:uroporphyrinogen III methyltransferase/synthase